jgi:Mg/Co/Ni transporter MgtE
MLGHHLNSPVTRQRLRSRPIADHVDGFADWLHRSGYKPASKLQYDQRMAIFDELGTEHPSDTLKEVEPLLQRELVSSLPLERTAELVNEMIPAQTADILAALPAPQTDAIQEKIDAVEAVKIRSLIDKHEDQILDFATTHTITFPPRQRWAK